MVSLLTMNGASRLRDFQHLLAGCIVFLGLAMLPTTGRGAGCHDSRQSVQGLDPYGNPLAENIVKTYSGGEFNYFVLPTGRLCEGPACRGIPPITITSQPAVTSTDRVNITFGECRISAGERLRSGRLCYQLELNFCNPVLDGLLRPPTI